MCFKMRLIVVVIILGWLSTTCGAFSIHWNNGQCNGTDCSTTSTENNGWSSKGGMEIHIMIDPREDPFSPSAKQRMCVNGRGSILRDVFLITLWVSPKHFYQGSHWQQIDRHFKGIRQLVALKLHRGYPSWFRGFGIQGKSPEWYYFRGYGVNHT